jgi:hypothetical protein
VMIGKAQVMDAKTIIGYSLWSLQGKARKP